MFLKKNITSTSHHVTQKSIQRDYISESKIKTSGETVLQTVRETALKVQRETRVAEIENFSPKIVMF